MNVDSRNRPSDRTPYNGKEKREKSGTSPEKLDVPAHIHHPNSQEDRRIIEYLRPPCYSRFKSSLCYVRPCLE